MPLLIRLSKEFCLYDTADTHRKRSNRKVSRLGGIVISLGLLISISSFMDITFAGTKTLIFAVCVLTVIGLKDDAFGGLRAEWKLIVHFAVALCMAYFGGYNIHSLHGLFSIQELGSTNSVVLSCLVMVFIINSFNLIDGVDGLATTIGCIASLLFGLNFALYGMEQHVCLAFTLTGITAGFLVYNCSPANVYMGDTGSTIIGIVIASMTINFLNLYKISKSVFIRPDNSVVIAIAILIVPTFDILRIIFIRLLKRKSPFKGDMNHTHHRLWALGLSDGQVVITLVSVNISLIAVSMWFQYLGAQTRLLLISGIAVVLNVLLTFLVYRKQDRQKEK